MMPSLLTFLVLLYGGHYVDGRLVHLPQPAWWVRPLVLTWMLATASAFCVFLGGLIYALSLTGS